ncbi:hexose carrier protein hex6 [Phtheirospermum japonicum]|uniref:Hexose carrier protein hex6 n=1 Tax=Phtheirospermum japonicum TaxID=374723 RepID=A0A830DAH0_9LAMI|nr:hexose carrier protein hex6 [Phtheirospermum japonicum]
MDPFLKKFFPGVYSNMKEDAEVSNYCKFDSQLLTAFSSSIYISGLFASFLASRITRDYGRRCSIIVGGIAFLLGAAIGGAAQGLYTLMLGRLLLGVGVGFANQGAFNFGFQSFLSVGTTAAFLINYGTSTIGTDWGWRISLATAKIRGVDDVEAELDDLLVANYNSAQIKHPFKKILKRSYRPYLVMAVAIPFFQQMTGITVISFYAPILFRTIGSDESASIMSSLITTSLGIVSTFLSSLVVDKVGRRVIFLFGGIQMFVSQMLIGAIMADKLGDRGALSQDVSEGYGVLVLVLVCVYVAGFGAFVGPVGLVGYQRDISVGDKVGPRRV